GEVIGVIGRNGAGKSTLLKVLSRITEPTHGRICIEGRMASLLEVGTGFHPELSGRENIFLNGAILGMSRSEIARKFDEIVAFAEVEKFLDTPVKRYSSGMYVRLAFAVAAHLESDIMLIDEVLAVGDAQFQKKCLGKMHDVAANQGRTILFVSHNTGVVASLCSKAILLQQGRLVMTGPVRDVLQFYNQQSSKESIELEADGKKPCITRVSIDQARICHGDFLLEADFSSPFPLNPPIIGVVVSTLMGVPVFATDALMHPEHFTPQHLSSGTARVVVRDLPLHPGEYRVSVFLAEQGAPYDYRRDVLTFDFMPRKPVAAKCPPIETIGALNIEAHWELNGENHDSVPARNGAFIHEDCAG
ncbi:MAG: ABC transporter ATP-binding protein, partial [Akkermansiaceae bacterium]|nr:ABC transporter ATP-binding protein [Verrucomicrobiales bacterium]